MGRQLVPHTHRDLRSNPGPRRDPGRLGVGRRALPLVLDVRCAVDAASVHCLAPSYIRTEGHDALVAQGVIRRKKAAEAAPAQRVGGVEEVVGPAVFLASDEAAFMHGAVAFVDGGWVVDACRC